MNKFFLVGLSCLCTLSFATHPSFTGDFNGFYFGPALAVGKTRMGVTNQRYRTTHFMLGGLAGYGQVSPSDLYWGGEVGLFHDNFSQSKEGQKVEKNNQLEGVLRFGQLIQHNFLPYIGLGGAYSSYKMHTTTQNKNFHTSDLISEVGVDAFVKPQLMIRSSLRYQRALGSSASSPVSVQKKPQSLFVKIGVSYIW